MTQQVLTISQPVTEKSYLQQRLEDLSITDEINTYIIQTESKNTPGQVIKEKCKFFEADAEGNIVINYYNLNGQVYSWRKEDTKWPRPYVRTRLRKEGIYHGNALPNTKQKYFQEKGSGQFPFFPPRIFKKFKACKESILPDGKATDPIDTLVVVEGEFKAFKGDMAGLDIIGIPSIHGFYNGDVRGKLHEDIQEVIVTCQVKKIIFLVDADLLTLKWEANKDLAKRAESFYASVKLFRESLQLLMDDEDVPLEMVYFMHLNTRFLNEAKGLDDLLIKYSAVHDEIKADLFCFQFAKKYFSGRLLNDVNKDLANLRKYLGLWDEQEFYKCYGDFIGSREFLFRNKRYEYNEEKKEVQFVRHEDADKYMRIGPDWIKIIKKKNHYGEIEEEMTPWSIAEINRDYRVGKNSDFFISQLLRFDGFCNEPAWNGDYKRVHDGCYNLVSPLRWDYVAGPFPHTYKFLKHIFQGAATLELNEDGTLKQENPILADQFTIILDWLSIVLRHPKHMLPVPILVSKENGTGKSTFLKWLNMIFGSNMCILGNDQFKMKFNGHYITKYIISIDEGFLDVDKKAEKERLKQLVTANYVYLENKGMNVTKIAYYSKLIICSNDADRVMKIDEGESRWFVVKVPVIPMKKLTGKEMLARGYNMLSGKPVEEDKIYEVRDANPKLESLMKSEIPAFIHFLRERNIFHPQVDRLWFDPEWFITDQYRVIVETTKNRLDKIFEEWIREMFILTKKASLQFGRKFILDELTRDNKSKYKIDETDIKGFLEPRGYKLSEKTLYVTSPRHKIETPQVAASPDPNNAIQPDSSELIDWMKYSARAYTFYADDWVKPVDEIKDNKGTDDLPF